MRQPLLLKEMQEQARNVSAHLTQVRRATPMAKKKLPMMTPRTLQMTQQTTLTPMMTQTKTKTRMTLHQQRKTLKLKMLLNLKQKKG